MEHHFNVEIAKEYGMLEAVLLNQFNFWLSKNKANGKHFVDGKYWTYNSARAFSEMFPYVSQSTIQRAISHLEKEGLIEIGEFNEKSFDRTKWYAFTDKGWLLFQNDKLDWSKWVMDVGQNDQTIPVNNPIYINTNTVNNNTICTEQNAAVPKDVFITLSLNNNTEYEITSELLKEFKDLYPAVDVEQELRNMKAWCLSNPKKRKTKSGILRFVNSWLSKEQNKPHIDTRPKRIVGGELSDEWNGGIGN